MKMRWFVKFGIILAGVGGILLVPTWRTVVFGLVRNEKTYRGKPTGYWTRALVDRDGDAVRETVATLKAGGTQAIPMLIEGLADKDPQKRRCVAEALGAIGKEAVPTLIAALGDHEPIVQLGAARALSHIGPDARDAIPALQATMKDEIPLIDMMAVKALSQIGQEAVPVLADALRDLKNASVRLTILEALNRMGPEAAAAVPALVAVSKEDNRSVGEMAGEVLKKVDPEAAAKAGVP